MKDWLIVIAALIIVTFFDAECDKILLWAYEDKGFASVFRFVIAASVLGFAFELFQHKDKPNIIKDENKT